MLKHNVHLHISLSDEIFITVNTGVADRLALLPFPYIRIVRAKNKTRTKVVHNNVSHGRNKVRGSEILKNH